MPRPKNFMAQGPRPTATRDDDIAALYERVHPHDRRETRSLPVDAIRPNPFQARRTFGDLEELAAAIRTHGFISWLRVRPAPGSPGTFELVYGERRLRAARLAGLTDVPCEIVAHTDAQMIELGLAENIQRQDLDPLEEARMFATLIAERGYTQRSLAERIGKDKGYLENRLALLRTPTDVQQMVAARPDAMSAARIIAKVPTADEREPLIAGVLAGTLTKQDVAALVDQAREEAQSGGQDAPASALVSELSPGGAVPDAVRLGDRQLARDIALVRAVVDRWATASVTAAQRRQLESFVDDELMPDLTALRQSLEAGGKRRKQDT